jgi:hypothetical protein
MPIDDAVLAEMIASAHAHKVEAEAARRRYEQSEAALVGYLQENRRKQVMLEQGAGHYLKVNMVVGERVVIDETKLKKAIGARAFNKLTHRVLDKKLLESAVARGEVDATVLAIASEVKPNKAYLRFDTVEDNE